VYDKRLQVGRKDEPVLGLLREAKADFGTDDLAERLRVSGEVAGEAQQPSKAAASPVEARRSDQSRASRIAAEKCGGAVTGRFAAVRVNP
jgi:hypothetical protein